MLDSLINPAPTVSRETPAGFVRWPIDRIADNPYQPRRAYPDDGIAELASNILLLADDLVATSGLQQLPMARLLVDGHHCERGIYDDPAAIADLLGNPGAIAQLFFGHRRLRAWRILAADNPIYATMPIQLAHADDRSMWQHVVSENSQREDITAIEEAIALKSAMDQFGLSTGDAAKPFGWSRSTAANKLRLLNLPESIQERVLTGEISEKQARSLLRIAGDGPEQAEELAAQAAEMSSRELEAKVSAVRDRLDDEAEERRQWQAIRDAGNELRATTTRDPVVIAEEAAWRQRRNSEREANEVEANRLVDEYMRGVDPAEMWKSSETWWKVLAKTEYWVWLDVLHKGTGTAVEKQAAIIRSALLGRRSWDKDFEGNIYNLDEIKARIRKLGGHPAPIREQPAPAPGDSQDLDWQTGWTDEDQLQFADLDFGANWTLEQITRPLVALRILADQKDKDLRAPLWRRYNELAEPRGNDASPLQ